MTRKEAIRLLSGLMFKGKLKEALDVAIKALEQEPTTKNNLGVDCISRTRAIERLKLNFPISQGADNSRDRHRYMQALADLQAIKELPSVTPQEPKTGHWIKGYTFPDGAYWKCDKCNELIKVKIPMHYCNNCGAKMVEPKESEEQKPSHQK